MTQIREYLDNIKAVHIELTDKCQAACPMCARNVNGGKDRPFIKNADITIDQFKQWFTPNFLSKLNNFYSCGNYGDPAFARDCLEIYSYVRECNPTTRLALHTNGSLRKPEWWKQLASVMEPNGQVIFAVDGFAGKHELYRRNTKFEKVIESITAFVEAGGDARVDSLVFAHNEHETEELEKFLLDLGVKEINFKSTKRFYNLGGFPVQDNNGNHLYDLEPATKPEWDTGFYGNIEKFLNPGAIRELTKIATVKPQCITKEELYIDPYGNILPCCWIGSDWIEEPLNGDFVLQKLRDITVEDSKNVFNDVGVPNLNTANIDDLLQKIDMWSKLEQYWIGENKCITCVKNCSGMLYAK
jgi:MoaA/NifB/PqqE/SkfB family radical SAM enzyme